MNNHSHIVSVWDMPGHVLKCWRHFLPKVLKTRTFWGKRLSIIHETSLFLIAEKTMVQLIGKIVYILKFSFAFYHRHSVSPVSHAYQSFINLVDLPAIFLGKRFCNQTLQLCFQEPIVTVKKFIELPTAAGCSSNVEGTKSMHSISVFETNWRMTIEIKLDQSQWLLIQRSTK